jgi:hypothetical protein
MLEQVVVVVLEEPLLEVPMLDQVVMVEMVVLLYLL